MAVNRRTLADEAVGPEKVSDSLRRHRYARAEFMNEPLCWTKTDGNGIPTGTTAAENLFFTGEHTFEYYILGAGQTIVAPVLASEAGYDFGMDQTAAEGVEINFGSHKTAHPRCYLVGTEAFYARLRFTVEDVSGVDFFFGFRKVGAAAVALATYTDLAGFQLLGDSSSALSPINLLTNLNDATDITSVDTTQTLADGIEVELEVQVRADRTARFFKNGASPTVDVTSFSFDSGDYLTPFAYILHTTDVAGQIKLLSFECGLLDDRPVGLLTA